MRCPGSCPGAGNPLLRQGTGLREPIFGTLQVGCWKVLSLAAVPAWFLAYFQGFLAVISEALVAIILTLLCP